ncbi:hypothetical protein [Aquimarina hainanensis]|uniref:hypothetical protein n=1 Tax=Aquimarina hainanensis TaxID=1578017 RepID=UPI00361974EF
MECRMLINHISLSNRSYPSRLRTYAFQVTRHTKTLFHLEDGDGLDSRTPLQFSS